MKKICIYGCGKIGREADEYYNERGGVEVVFLCDGNPKKWGERICEKEIISPKMLKKRIDEVDAIVIATKKVDEVYMMLHELKIDLSKVLIYSNANCPNCKIDEYYRNLSWSQEGEDIWLQNKFAGRKGLYVDVGAFHPFRFSNTAWAYDAGWTGINIEPNVDNFHLFEVLRPNDININCGVFDEEGELTYYCYEEAALNGFDRTLYADIPVFEKKQIRVRRLSDICEEYGVKRIDFLDIDVEGLEMNVLRSIDFSIDIECILLEQIANVEDLAATSEFQFLKEKGYCAVAKYGRTIIYEKINDTGECCESLC